MVGRKPPPPASRTSPVPASAPLDRVQGALPGPLRAIPVQALLAGAGIVVVGALVLTMAPLRSDKAIEALEDDTPSADERGRSPRGRRGSVGRPVHGRARPRVRRAAHHGTRCWNAARIGGVDALKAPAQRFPEDRGGAPGARRRRRARQERVRRRPTCCDACCEIAPDRSADKDVQAVLIELANGPPEVAPEAFTLLETKMGAAGRRHPLRAARARRQQQDRKGPRRGRPREARGAQVRVGCAARRRGVAAVAQRVRAQASWSPARQPTATAARSPTCAACSRPRGAGGFSIFRRRSARA